MSKSFVHIVLSVQLYMQIRRAAMIYHPQITRLAMYSTFPFILYIHRFHQRLCYCIFCCIRTTKTSTPAVLCFSYISIRSGLGLYSMASSCVWLVMQGGFWFPGQNGTSSTAKANSDYLRELVGKWEARLATTYTTCSLYIRKQLAEASGMKIV